MQITVYGNGSNGRVGCPLSASSEVQSMFPPVQMSKTKNPKLPEPVVCGQLLNQLLHSVLHVQTSQQLTQSLVYRLK